MSLFRRKPRTVLLQRAAWQLDAGDVIQHNGRAAAVVAAYEVGGGTLRIGLSTGDAFTADAEEPFSLVARRA